VIRGINITNIAVNGNYFYSDPFPLPIPFVNNNNLHVFWQSAGIGETMVTSQADYIVINVPVNFWSLAAKPKANTTITDDSACFILMYI
jgi:hypothetical protein